MYAMLPHAFTGDTERSSALTPRLWQDHALLLQKCCFCMEVIYNLDHVKTLCNTFDAMLWPPFTLVCRDQRVCEYVTHQDALLYIPPQIELLCCGSQGP